MELSQNLIYDASDVSFVLPCFLTSHLRQQIPLQLRFVVNQTLLTAKEVVPFYHDQDVKPNISFIFFGGFIKSLVSPHLSALKLTAGDLPSRGGSEVMHSEGDSAVRKKRLFPQY